ncbi:MAG: toll/interleukin-1 receptor domain-containing protein [Myxococcota bacterium]
MARLSLLIGTDKDGIYHIGGTIPSAALREKEGDLGDDYTVTEALDYGPSDSLWLDHSLMEFLAIASAAAFLLSVAAIAFIAMRLRQFDVFISHASEDRSKIAMPLAHCLASRYGHRVWIDIERLELGDDLVEQVAYAVSQSRHAVLLLSEHALEKLWPREEMEGFFQRELRSGRRCILLPVLHGITQQRLALEYPFFENILMGSTDEGIECLAARIDRAILNRDITIGKLVSAGEQPSV